MGQTSPQAVAVTRWRSSPAILETHAQKYRILTVGLLAVAMLFASLSAAAARPAPDSFADLVEKVAPAVVNVSVVKQNPALVQFGDERGTPQPFGPGQPFNEFFKRFFGDEAPDFRPGPGSPDGPELRGQGSGFIVDPQGYVVTNHHVVAEADDIRVTLQDGRSLAAELVGQDAKTDLALLKVEAEGDLPFVAFGDSDAVRPGDWVLAVGNPFGLGGSVTAGIVSARGRDLPGGTIIDFLQIDAPINKGNSGGPAFDLEGRVIGVNAAIYSPNGGSVGIGFAIPSNLAQQVITDLRENGEVSRGWLGVRIQAVTPEIAEGFRLDKPRGALVSSVEPGSPAATAGLMAGDVILSWDDKPVDDLRDLPRLVAFTPEGKKVAIEVWRKGTEKALTVVTGSAPEAKRLAAVDTGPKASDDQIELAGTGLTVADLTDRHRAEFGISGEVTGAVILKVEPGSRAAQEGLRRGDVIRSLASTEVTTAKDAAHEIDQVKASGKEVVTLLVSRDGTDSFFALRLRSA